MKTLFKSNCVCVEFSELCLVVYFYQRKHCFKINIKGPRRLNIFIKCSMCVHLYNCLLFNGARYNCYILDKVFVKVTE